MLLFNSWLRVSLSAVHSFYCDAIVQHLIESLSSGCHQLLLLCYCATFDWESLFWLSSAFTVMLLCNIWLRVSLLAVISFYCDAIVQLLTESLSSGCHQLLLWCYCATFDWESLFWLSSAFTVVLLCNSWHKASLLALLCLYCDAFVQHLTESLTSGCAQLLLRCYCATFDWESLFWLSSAFTVVLLCNSWHKASLLALLCLYCDAIVQLLTERLSPGCALHLLWCYFATLDRQPLFCLCSAFTLMLKCNSWIRVSFLVVLTLMLLCNSWQRAFFLAVLCFDCCCYATLD